MFLTLFSLVSGDFYSYHLSVLKFYSIEPFNSWEMMNM